MVDERRGREEANAPELISKKEVLERTGISYGQFYRWKRKGLIPERWFSRKSTFTGQETFLPREKVLERIQQVKKLKDTYSLEEIAELLWAEPTTQLFAASELSGRHVIGEETLQAFREFSGHDGPFPFWDVFRMATLERLRAQELEPDEWELAMDTLDQELYKAERGGTEWMLWLVCKTTRSRASFCCLTAGAKAVFDPETRVTARVDLNRVLEETRMNVSEIWRDEKWTS